MVIDGGVRIAVLATIFVIGVIVAGILRVEQRRRSLPRWLSFGILLAAFVPLVLDEFEYMPGLIGDGTIVAVGVAFGLWIGLPLVFTHFRTAPQDQSSPSQARPELVGHHVRPAPSTFPAGVYRVVGTDTARVTLLRITDDQGRRIHSGEVIGVSSTEYTSTFSAADNPDQGVHPVRILRNQLKGLYWSVRKFL